MTRSDSHALDMNNGTNNITITSSMEICFQIDADLN
jgi:hypothetical protein